MPAAKKKVPAKKKRAYVRKAPVKPTTHPYYVVRSINSSCQSDSNGETFHDVDGENKPWAESAEIVGPFKVENVNKALEAYDKFYGIDDDEIVTVVCVELSYVAKYRASRELRLEAVTN